MAIVVVTFREWRRNGGVTHVVFCSKKIAAALLKFLVMPYTPLKRGVNNIVILASFPATWVVLLFFSLLLVQAFYTLPLCDEVTLGFTEAISSEHAFVFSSTYEGLIRKLLCRIRRLRSNSCDALDCMGYCLRTFSYGAAENLRSTQGT